MRVVLPELVENGENGIPIVDLCIPEEFGVVDNLGEVIEGGGGVEKQAAGEEHVLDGGGGGDAGEHAVHNLLELFKFADRELRVIDVGVIIEAAHAFSGVETILDGVAVAELGATLAFGRRALVGLGRWRGVSFRVGIVLVGHDEPS